MADRSGKAQGRSRAQGQSRHPNETRQRGARNGAPMREQDEQGQEQQSQQEDEGAVGSATTRVADTMKQHPITTAALGAGLTLLAAQGLRMAVGATGRNRQQSDEEEQDESAQGSSEQDQVEEEEGDADRSEAGGGFTGRLGRIGSKFGSAFRRPGQAIQRGAKSGFQRGRERAQQGWSDHPLTLAGVALVVGAAAGYLLPPTRQEDRLMGKASDKLTGRIRKGGKSFFRQGRSVAGKVVHEAVETTQREAEREGLTPDKLGKKVRRVLGNVRQAVAEAIEEE
jgi:hypothetical protein